MGTELFRMKQLFELRPNGNLGGFFQS